MSNIYTMAEPLLQTIATSDGEHTAEIDIIVAQDVVAKIQKELDTTASVPVAERFRPWVAEKLNVGPDALTIGQVADLVNMIVEVGNRAIDESKKKLSTTLSSLFSSRESPGITENGQGQQKTPGSETTQGVSLGQSELGEQ